MAYLLDGILVLILVLSIWSGHRRGFIQTISGLLAFVIALVVSMLLSGPVASFVNETWVQPSVEKTIAPYVDEVATTAEEAVNGALEALPDFVTDLLANKGIVSGADVLEQTEPEEEPTNLSHRIADQVVTPVLLPLIKVLCTLILFLLMYMIARLVLRVLDVVAKLPLLKQLNKGLGALAGAVTGVLWVLFAVSLMQLAAAFGGNDFVINQALLSDTLLVNWLLSVNPIGQALQQVMSGVNG